MIGKPAVAGIENARDAGQFRQGKERPGPPDLPREEYDGFGAAVNFAVARGDAHFPKQFPRRQGEKRLHARILQSRESEAAFFKRQAEAAGQRSADGAIAVEADPAAGGVPSFRISHF